MSVDIPAVRLGEIVSIKGGKRLPKGASLQKHPNQHPYIRVRDMGHRYIPEEGLEYVPDHVFPAIQRYIVNENDLIISIVGTIGLISIVDSRFHLASQTENAAKLSGLDKSDAQYLYYFLSSNQGQIEIQQRTVGAVQPKLPLYNIEQIPIIWPSKTSRERIAAVLGVLDDKIQLNQQINQTLEQMAQAIFKSWFVDFEPVKAKIAALEAGGSEEDALLAAMQAISGKDAAALSRLQTEHPDQYAELRTTAELFPSAMQDSELGEIPIGWSTKQIGDIVNRLPVGKKYSQKTASKIGIVPILDQGKSGIIGYHAGDPGLQACPEDPIIVFANHTCYMRLIMHDFSTIQNVLPYKGKQLDIYWTYFATLSKQEFVEYKGHWPDFMIKDVILPSNHLDKHFGNYVSPMMRAIFRFEQQNTTQSDIRDALLPKLLSGELSVTDNAPQLAEVTNN